MFLLELSAHSLLTYKDIIVTPLYVIIILALTSFLINKNKHLPKNIKPIFFWAIISRLVGSVLFALVHHTVYQYGDTWNYFTYGSYYMWEALWDDPSIAFTMVFQSQFDEFNPITVDYVSRMQAWNGGNLMIKTTFFVSLITGHSYIPTAFIFSLIGFFGLWRIYIVFVSYYPHLYRELAFACFFSPSMIFWSSGVMKEAICIGALGGAFYAFHRIGKQFSWIYIIQLILFSLVILIYKSYILICFLGVGFYWLYLQFINQISSKTLRWLIGPFLLLSFISAGITSIFLVGYFEPKYSIAKVMETVESSSTYLYKKSLTEQGSAYFLGDLDYSIGGMIKKIVPGINVSLFRPYIFEAKNPVMLISALESSIFLLIGLLVLFKLFLKPSKISIEIQPLVSFSIAFTLIFAYFIGISTLNFGTLVRYRIPILPFFLSALFILNFIYGNRYERLTNKK